MFKKFRKKDENQNPKSEKPETPKPVEAEKESNKGNNNPGTRFNALVKVGLGSAKKVADNAQILGRTAANKVSETAKEAGNAAKKAAETAQNLGRKAGDTAKKPVDAASKRLKDDWEAQKKNSTGSKILDVFAPFAPPKKQPPKDQPSQPGKK